jgi:hypothetical protein
MEKYVAPFRALGPARDTTNSSLSYHDIFVLNRNTEESTEICEKGWYRHLFPTGLKRYDPTAQRKVYDIFNNLTGTFPDLVPASLYIIEGYPTQGVRAIPDYSTAFPHRGDSILQ